MTQPSQPPALSPLAPGYRGIDREILLILNGPESVSETIERVVAVLKLRLGFDAVGMRLQCGDDFPYFAQRGFSDDFLARENSLLARNAAGGVCRKKDGSLCLECTCGLVISGQTDPSNPLFTQGGSCWTNDSFPLLQVPASADPRLHPRNRCIHQGYASVALVPVRTTERIVGLLQLNDRREGRFTLEMIEHLEGIAAHIGATLMRKRAEAALRQANEDLEQRVAERTNELRRVNADLAKELAERQRTTAILQARLRISDFALGHSLGEVLTRMLDEAELLTGSTLGFYELVEAAPRQLAGPVWSSNALQHLHSLPGGHAACAAAIAGVCAEVWREGRSVVRPAHAGQPPESGPSPGHGPGLRLLVVPVLQQGQVVALLGVGNKPSDYEAADLESVARIADLTWHIAESKRAEAQIRRALEEKEVLLKEVHHRVKNNLQTVSGLLNLQAECVADPRLTEAFKQSQARIKSIALVHEVLYQEKGLARLNFKAYVRSLIAHISRAHLGQRPAVSLEVQMPEVTLDLASAVPCGLLLNELVTNSLKHAFRAERPESDNKVGLAWEDAGANWRFTVADNGPGLPAEKAGPPGSTLGLSLVQMLARQLKGTVCLGPGPGCRWLVEFPKA